MNEGFSYDDTVAKRIEEAAECMEPGQLLVSLPPAGEDSFERSVVLVLECNVEAIIGVDLTSRSDVAVHNVVPEWVPAVADPKAVYIGGPVNQQAIMCVGRTKVGVRWGEYDEFQTLANRLVLVRPQSDPEHIAELVDGVRLFAGYSEWTPDEVFDGIGEGRWFITPALPGDVIVPARVDLWSQVMRRQADTLMYQMMSTFPANLRDN